WNKIIYRVSTGIFCAFLLLTGISYFTDSKFVEIYKHLGFPQYFRIELGIAKILGVVLLALPFIPRRIKEWVYVGFGITLISGLIAHVNSSDGKGYILNILFFFTLLIISYAYWHKSNTSL
ncbi:MAG: DoxX family protein, partial [Ferruginibacter sp.]